VQATAASVRSGVGLPLPCLFYVYGYPPFSVHNVRGAILLAECARKLNPEISVALVVGREVFGRKHKGTKAESAAMAWLQSHDHA
jgi:hypothetical protein